MARLEQSKKGTWRLIEGFSDTIAADSFLPWWWRQSCTNMGKWRESKILENSPTQWPGRRPSIFAPKVKLAAWKEKVTSREQSRPEMWRSTNGSRDTITTNSFSPRWWSKSRALKILKRQFDENPIHFCPWIRWHASNDPIREGEDQQNGSGTR